MSISCARLLCDAYENGNCIVQCAVILGLHFRKTTTTKKDILLTSRKVKNKLFSESPKCSDLFEEWPLGIRPQGGFKIIYNMYLEPDEPELLDAN